LDDNVLPLQLGSIEYSEFYEKPVPYWPVCLADTSDRSDCFLRFARRPSVFHRHWLARGTRITVNIRDANAQCMLAIALLSGVPDEFCARAGDVLRAQRCTVYAQCKSVRVACGTLNTNIDRYPAIDGRIRRRSIDGHNQLARLHNDRSSWWTRIINALAIDHRQ